ncbi:MAG: YncE family protein [Cyclobacteriaceae bacterium]|nr:YncE family protein [Cyclobacteriaceae bacterium]
MINIKQKTALTLSAMVLAGGMATAQSIVKSERIAPGLYELAVSEKDNHVYVASVGSRTTPGGYIFKLDPQTLAKVDSFNLKETPPFGVTINQKTQTLYTSNTRTNSVSAVDLKTGKVLATIKHGKEKSHTRELIVDEDTNTIYVSDVGDPSSIWVIDGKTNTFSYLIENTGKTTTGMALDKKKKQIYVTNMGSNEIAVIDVASKKVVRTFPSVGESPTNIIFDAKGDRLFVVNQKTADLNVFEASTGKHIHNIKTGEGALGVNYDAKRNRIYVANRTAGTVTVIDAKTYAVVSSLNTGTYPNTVAINPKTGNAYVTNKAKSARRDDPTPQAPDLNGDTVTLIKL